MVQDAEQGKHERRIKQYMGVDDIGELTEGVWEYHSESIKRNAPYLFYQNNFEGLKVIFEWLLKVFEKDLQPAYSALFMLDELAVIMRNAREIHPWGVIGAEDRKDKVKDIIDTIERLERLLQDECIPPLPEVTWFLGSSRGMWLDRNVAKVTHKWCRDNNACHPKDLGLGDFFSSLKSHMQGTLNLPKATPKPGTASDNTPSRRAEAMIFSQRMAKAMLHVFKLKQKPNVVIAAMVNMLFRDVEGITAQKVQEWVKKIKP